MTKTFWRFFLLIICNVILVTGCGKTARPVFDTDTEVAGSEDLALQTDKDDVVLPGEGFKIYVYVCGEVKCPGVYELLDGSRICDAIDAAGGMTETACTDYLNLASYVSDGQKIEVLTNEEVALIVEQEEKDASGLININEAMLEELITLPGIGETRASSIISFREKNGPFDKIEDIMNVSGIKEAAFEKIQAYITVE